MGACAGAFAAAATTPLDVIKTNMMCTAASRPTMMSAGRAVLAQGGPRYFFRYVIQILPVNAFACCKLANMSQLQPTLVPTQLETFVHVCRGVGARALSNGINSAVFFCFFEALRATFAKKKEQVAMQSCMTCFFLG